jgi:rubrerythrin
MNQTSLLNRVHFLLLLIIPFGFALLLISFFYGCSSEKKHEVKKPAHEVSLENLQAAYAKSVRHQYMYSVFVRQAEKEKNKQIALLYRAITRSEGIHAYNHAGLMKKYGVEPLQPQIDSVVVGMVLQTLKMAQSSEEIETESMYPNLIRTAGLEKFPEAETQFEQTREADIRQLELIRDAYERSGKIQKVPYYVCGGCGYIATSDKIEECPVCGATKEKFEKII